MTADRPPLPPEIKAAIDALVLHARENDAAWRRWNGPDLNDARAALEAIIAGLVEKAEKAEARYNRICDMASSSRRGAGTPWP